MKKHKIHISFLKKLFTLPAFFFFLLSCHSNSDNKTADTPVYVQPSISKNGTFRKGHVKMPVSTSKNAIMNQNRSRYYYHTRGKYRK